MNSVSPISRSRLLRPDPDVRVLRDEQAELVGEVEVGLVVRRRRQQDALAVVRADVLLDRPVALALAVAEVVALVDEDEAIAAEVGQLALDDAVRQDARPRAGTGRGSPPTSRPGSSGR